MITGKVTGLTTGQRGSATVEVSVIKAYKAGQLNITKSGPVMSVILTSTCKRCPGLIKGTVQVSVFAAYVSLHITHTHALKVVKMIKKDYKERKQVFLLWIRVRCLS